ncbi:MAG TPA: sulfate adenylyltransferase small subunit, partial [Bacteroidetes bacterium]|nr:sulfate adenylyltransferase small subunit [Bacteroidota bacterium]
VFPLSNWTELDIWQYIKREKLDIPSIYFSHSRKVILKDNIFLAVSDFINIQGYKIMEKEVRCRTVGDITTTGLWESEAKNIEEIIMEISVSGIGERGKRTDDKTSFSSMEDRKRQGYF